MALSNLVAGLREAISIGSYRYVRNMLFFHGRAHFHFDEIPRVGGDTFQNIGPTKKAIMLGAGFEEGGSVANRVFQR